MPRRRGTGRSVRTGAFVLAAGGLLTERPGITHDDVDDLEAMGVPRYRYLAEWEKHDITQRVLDGLRDRVRIAEGRTAEPSAAIIDSQSVEVAEEASKNSRGFDAGKKITAANATSPWTASGCCSW